MADRRTPHGFNLLNAVVLILATVGSLLLCEVLVRWFVPVRNVGPTFSVYDARYGKVLKESFSCMRITPEFTMRFTTNSLGFRGPEPEGFPFRPILFIGDSFTSGYGVNDGEEFPELVRRALAKQYGEGAVPVVNAGSGNTGNGYWVKFLNLDARKLNPRLVVFQFCGNDFADNVAEEFFTLSPDGSLIEHFLPEQETGLRAVQEFLEKIPGLSYSYLAALGRQAFAREGYSPDSIAESPANIELTERIIDEALTICARAGWSAIGLSAASEDAGLDSVAAVFQRHKVAFLRIPGPESRADLYYRVDKHWNAAGHAYVAQQLLDRFANDTFIQKVHL